VSWRKNTTAFLDSAHIYWGSAQSNSHFSICASIATTRKPGWLARFQGRRVEMRLHGNSARLAARSGWSGCGQFRFPELRLPSVSQFQTSDETTGDNAAHTLPMRLQLKDHGRLVKLLIIRMKYHAGSAGAHHVPVQHGTSSCTCWETDLCRRRELSSPDPTIPAALPLLSAW
jgi:hypothetical protein